MLMDLAKTPYLGYPPSWVTWEKRHAEWRRAQEEVAQALARKESKRRDQLAVLPFDVPAGNIELEFGRRELVTKLLAHLTPRQYGIVLARNRGATLQELAKEYRVTKERIRQIERYALRKMREKIIDLL